jgi:hypothetical protein
MRYLQYQREKKNDELVSKIKSIQKMNAYKNYLIKPLFLNKGLISGSCPVKSLNA